MAKYYVRCGRLRDVLDSRNMEQAAYRVVQTAARSRDGRFLPLSAVKELGLVTSVSERGFRDKAATCYPTHFILAEVGPFREFRRRR